jgi:hypothetical protein
MAFDHSRRRWFGTCPCRPVPRGLPSSVKQLRTTQPFSLSRSWHTIIGIPRQLISSQSHLPIKRRQKYVTERGRNYTPLRSATFTGKELPFTVASRLEHRLDEAKHSTIRYPLGYQREKLFMIHGPEKVSEVRIHDPLRPALNLFPHFAQRILRYSPGLSLFGMGCWRTGRG